ncbi:MAG: alpha/beta hydrolase [Planctomycetaceae bacterium]|nr:alpha/beta hydrolase [Planctomycetaceae bacterium]MCA9043418.1 alpha/beta hydrolase [Planctomycetaceae bacterium]
MHRLLFCSFILLHAASLHAESPESVVLWPDGAPGALGTDAADVPSLLIYRAEESKRSGCAVVVCPGGGYGGLAMDHEGYQIADWYNSLGVTAVIVKYRLGPKYNHPAPLQDASRAVRYTRAHAADLQIDPNRIGIMGFSAGGHLASTVSTHFDAGEKDSPDLIARQSSRPDFAVLCYPVISLKSAFTHGGSKRNLLGENPDEDLVNSLSNETQVTKDTPPTFIFHTHEDQAVPVMNAVVYYQALVENGVPSEMHIYQKGRHGVGLAFSDPILKSWSGRLVDWLNSNEFLKAQ